MSELRTGRLLLRMPEARDAEALAHLADDWDVARMLTPMPFPYTLEDARTFIAHIHEEQSREWGIFQDSQYIGGVSTNQELGYWLGRPYWGQGYITEAATAALDHYFAQTNADGITSGAFVDNPASLKVQTKLGFVETGRSLGFSRARAEEVRRIDTRLDRAVWLERRKSSD